MLATVTSIIGIVGLVFTIGLLAWQTRATARQAEIANAIAAANVLFDSTSSLRDVLLRFVEHPELRAYFYDGEPCPTERQQRSRVITIGEMLADTLEDGLVSHRLVPATESEADWLGYCRYLRTRSPTLDSLVNEHSDWWPQLSRISAGPADLDDVTVHITETHNA